MSVLNLFKLEDRVALITGAGRGIGRALAHALAEAGAHLIIADVLEDNGLRVVEEIEKLGRRAVFVRTDVSDYASVESMLESARKAFPRIHILINNAGVTYSAGANSKGRASIPTEEVSPKDWDLVIKINLGGVFYCSQVVGKHMIEQGAGTIINLASMSAFIANFGRHNNAYCASKAGVVMFTRQLAADWAKYGIRVNAIAPGYIRTEIGAGPMEDPLIKDFIAKRTALGRSGAPDDLKGLAVFLASDASSFITGQTVVIDGGYTLW